MPVQHFDFMPVILFSAYFVTATEVRGVVGAPFLKTYKIYIIFNYTFTAARFGNREKGIK